MTATCHDTELTENRKTHHLVAGKLQCKPTKYSKEYGH